MRVMTEDLTNVIGAALDQARAAGLDSVACFKRAVRQVRLVRPDLSPDEAWLLVETGMTRPATAAFIHG